MGTYSIKGSPDFDARLTLDFARISTALAESPHGAAVRALVLIGGYGRGEGTPWIVNGHEAPFNDYDFVVVSGPMSRRRRNRIQSDLRRLEQRLSRDVNLPVDLCLYTDQDLRRAEFSMLNYEMKYGHRVVWGEDRILERMPAYPIGALPLSEGTRLLLNRGKLLLDVRRALRTGGAPDAEQRLRWVKFTLKAQLAFGDCALLRRGAYDLRYTVKQERIAECAGDGMPDPGFLIEGYRRAIALKEWGDYSFLETADWGADFERVRQYFVAFFHWYETARLGAPTPSPDAYTRALSRGPQECPAWKAVLLNLKTFGVPTGPESRRLWRSHPRSRLYLALPVLLGDDPVDGMRWSRILGAGPDRASLERRFYELQKRFS